MAGSAMRDAEAVRTLLTVDQVAAATGWKPSTVRDKVLRRQIEYIKVGRLVRFRAETIERLIDQGTVPALEQAY